MYPIRLGYKTAKNRIIRLLKNGHEAEALVSIVATVEKTLRRTLKQLIISAGFSTEGADKIVRNLRSFEQIKQHWFLFEPQNRYLIDVIGNSSWQVITEAATKRNKLVHGLQVYSRSECDKTVREVMQALDTVKETFNIEYGYYGWSRIHGRKNPILHLDPKVHL